MKDFEQYWTFSAIRGVLTIMFAAGILAVPQAAVAIVSIPVMIGLAIDVLATYLILDAGVMFLLGKLMPERAHSRRMLYVQALAAIVIGFVLNLFTYGAIPAKYLLLLVAFGAALAAVFEFRVARDTHAQYGCFSCYTTAITLAVCAIMLPFFGGLDATQTSVVLAMYVAFYGTSQFLLAARMLFVAYRAAHPATAMSEAWRTEMNADTVVAHVAAGCPGCAACPADAICSDFSQEGQIARVKASRQPSIVRTVRVASLMEPAGVYRAR